MKKNIILGIIFIIFGFILGELIFEDKIELIKKIKKGDTYYFLQEGVYKDYNNIQNNLNEISKKIIERKKDKYYVYVGITKDQDVLEKLKKIYNKKNIVVYPKEVILSSREFSTNVDQFDFLIKQTNDNDQILTIEEVVLSNYEEIVKK
ncbi:MAG: hypothetical protein IJ097_03155 [Bacilli bacterium]|nr:hypothetical protein [Bacilli bacterium]